MGDLEFLSGASGVIYLRPTKKFKHGLLAEEAKHAPAAVSIWFASE